MSNNICNIRMAESSMIVLLNQVDWYAFQNCSIREQADSLPAKSIYEPKQDVRALQSTAGFR
jgi:hypothetical protein